jgi:hypothetical protein
MTKNLNSFRERLLLFVTRWLPYVSYLNVVLLICFAFCFCQIYGLVSDDHILSITKMLDLTRLQGWYTILLLALLLFNLWLTFWPMICFIYRYQAVLKIEFKQIGFDLLVLFVSLFFSVVIVYGFACLNSYLVFLTADLVKGNLPDVNIYIQLKNLILQGVFEFGCAPQNCVTCDPGSSSSPNTPGSLDSCNKFSFSNRFLSSRTENLSHTSFSGPAEDGAPTSGSSGGGGSEPDKSRAEKVMVFKPGQFTSTSANGKIRCGNTCAPFEYIAGVGEEKDPGMLKKMLEFIPKMGAKSACLELEKHKLDAICVPNVGPVEIARPHLHPEQAQIALESQILKTAASKQQEDVYRTQIDKHNRQKKSGWGW